MTAKQLPDDTYLDKIYTMLAQIEQEEGAAMDAAARAAYASIDGGGLLHVFSTGHSHMIVEEMFYRSGGLVPVNPILSDELMLHTGAITSTHMERMPGKAAEVLGKAGLRAGDTILISSNTGINTVPVEAALYAKERGLTVVCVTSKKISRTLASRAPEGKRLYEVSDIVIDNHAPRGDGLLDDPRHPADHRRRVHLRKPVHRAAHRTEDRKPVSCAGADAAGPVQRQSARRRRIQYQRGGGVSGPYQSAVLRMR